MTEEIPTGRELHEEEIRMMIWERERDCWQWTSIRVPDKILQMWLAMLRNNSYRGKVYKQMQKFMWRHPRAPVIRPCGCRMCNPGWGT
uniref:Probable Vpr-like protein n=1 Tax=Caprine arthritis encephalitis virus TaxID=11660 RepID=F6LY19_CAEV|nr:tat protein [Caprine arthritis encephalitis virus]